MLFQSWASRSEDVSVTYSRKKQKRYAFKKIFVFLNNAKKNPNRSACLAHWKNKCHSFIFVGLKLCFQKHEKCGSKKHFFFFGNNQCFIVSMKSVPLFVTFKAMKRCYYSSGNRYKILMKFVCIFPLLALSSVNV